MQKIVPHLWFDTQAWEAADFYLSVFPQSKDLGRYIIEDTPSGDAQSVTLELYEQKFMLISAGPYFTINPSVSFLIACSSKEEVDALWNRLIDGGEAMMALDRYPFSDHYGWVVDKFGVSWQIMWMGDMPYTQKITPTLMFVGENAGKCEAAINEYVALFHHAKINGLERYGEGMAPNHPEMIKHIAFDLENVSFAAMDSAYEHLFEFNEAVSFVVYCDTQEEIDYYWNKLSFVPESEQCGWLKDKYGFSWQIVPTLMEDVMNNGNPDQIKRVTEAFLQMKKFNVADLLMAYQG
jgi:predicted 3-demethylubiquinone-9 3-methyltransferase (glyoxalase superfamily)